MDREFQKNLLLFLEERYPEFVSGKLLSSMYNEQYPPARDAHWLEKGVAYQRPKGLMKELDYLSGHGLIEIKYETLDEVVPRVKLTPVGRDFLEEDGGLSAILNTVTVKFDAENIRGLMEAGLLRANLPEEKRKPLLEAIKNAPTLVLQTAMTKLVEVGMADPVGSAKALAGVFGVHF